MLPGLVFVTASDDKHREAEAILGIPVERVALDLAEPQGLDVVGVAREKARAAQARLARESSSEGPTATFDGVPSAASVSSTSTASAREAPRQSPRRRALRPSTRVTTSVASARSEAGACGSWSPSFALR